jgi:hypothetical protein
VDKTGQAADGLDEHKHEHEHGQRDLPTISYAIHRQAILMSRWEDPHYFTGAFPTLFPNGLGGHQDQRLIPVLLNAFAQWALNHHSRRLESLVNTIPLKYYNILLIFIGLLTIRRLCTFSII